MDQIVYLAVQIDAVTIIADAEMTETIVAETIEIADAAMIETTDAAMTEMTDA